MDVNKVIARAKSMLLTPRTEWPIVAVEPDTIGGLYSGYILLVAAIPSLAFFLSTAVVGVSVPFLGTYYRVSIATALTRAILRYVLSLAGVYIVALIIEYFAPTFGAEKNRTQALKAVAYSYTASWVISIVGIIPGLALIAALAGAIYSVYLLNMGLPYTMKCPDDKSIGYTAVTVIAAIVVFFVLGLVVSAVAGVDTGMVRAP
jgi:hypothetical protein